VNFNLRTFKLKHS